MDIFNIVLDALYPRKCAFCGKIMRFSIEERDYDLCGECIRNAQIQYDGGKVLFAFEYSGNVRKCILNFKFNDCYIYGKTIARFIYEVSKDIDFDLITAVPSHRKQIIKRGYDHTKIIAEYVSQYSNRPYIRLIEKIKNTKPQKDCTLRERRENVKNAFSVIGNAAKGKSILIIDDVCTTGSTLNECERILKKNQAKNITKAVMAKHSECSK